MVSPTITGALGYRVIDLDEFAAALADLASAIDRRDSAEALDHLDRVTAVDPDTGHALADFLTVMEMFEEVSR
jgi:hypothetical protein